MNKKILVIDDDIDQAMLYFIAFQRAGITIETADGGHYGLAQARAIHPDLILLDIIMEDMTGIEVLRQLKGDDATKNIPVIMLSNTAGKDVMEQTKDLGALAFWEKTKVMPTEIVEKCKKILEAVN